MKSAKKYSPKIRPGGWHPGRDLPAPPVAAGDVHPRADEVAAAEPAATPATAAAEESK